jgi:NADH dehydrogenase/NADH:ubiquinone oxidoreductase subunit G
MIHLTLDDKAIEVPEGRTLLEACREHDIEIPTLCYHPALEPYGACRLCMVEFSMPPRPSKLVAACVYPCQEGVVVRTNSEAVRSSRRMTIELLLSSAPNDPTLLQLAQEYDVKEIRFRMTEENLCVLCGLCVRACNEIVGVRAISMINRGISKEISPPFKTISPTCIGCSTCVLICPTGYIKLKDVIGYRSVHFSETDIERVYCQICSDLDLQPTVIDDIETLIKNPAGHPFDKE